MFKLHITDPEAALRSHLYLRLMVVTLAAIVLAVHHQIAEPIAALPWLLLILGATATWTLARALAGFIARSRLQFAFEMLLDYLWVFAIVALVGRSTNPFIYYYLVLTAIAAAALPSLFAWSFCALGIAIYSALMYLDVNVHFHHMPQAYRTHLLGMWLNYVGSSLVSCFFVSYLRKWGQAQQKQLTLARETQLKNEQLIGIGTVAASTIHSLATPLATLNLLVEDMNHQQRWDPETARDLQLMHAQIHRCRQTIDSLAGMARQHDELQPLTCDEIVSGLREHYTLQHPDTGFDIEYVDACGQTRVLADPLLMHALINLVNNAVESDCNTSQIKLSADSDHLFIEIRNRTSQSAADIVQRWGRPGESTKQTGLGIGSMLANSTIERLQGSVTLTQQPLSGAANQVAIRIALRRWRPERDSSPSAAGDTAAKQ